ncbi:MAG TPA: 6-pyruvoyl-tetrahydropterin synthase-related protein [Pyrinomonadaceae bacterium]|nr:6-pyruvoyl-tetrahydropterin synthase-related protein [Pyrinomonadaceae bacterium]
MESQSITILSNEGFAPHPVAVDHPEVAGRKGRHEFRNVSIVAVVAIAVLLPIVVFGIPNGADLPNHLRFALPFYESIQAGHLHPGWLAESNYGLGDPRFIFYPPGLYYLLSASRMLTGEWFSASILVFLFLSIAGGLGAYFWAHTIFSPSVAMWTGILYTLAPYRLNELYQASLLSEYAACSVVPLAFAFVERVIRKKSIYDVIGLGAAYALLILTHLPITVIGSLALTAYALIRIERKFLLATLARLALGVTLGLAASSFFWTSMLAELSWIKGNSAGLNPYYDYRLNFLFSPSALTNRNTWYANVLALAMIGFLLPGLVFILRSFKQEKSKRALTAVLALLLVTFLMATSLSKPVWAIVPKLSEVQFPWRWLSITSLMGAILFAAGIPKWQEQLRKRIRPRDLAVGLAFALSLVFIGTQIIQESEYISRAKFEPMVQEVRGAVSFKDWLPASARDFNNVEKMSAKVDAGARPVTVTSWEPERRTFHLGAGSENTVQVRTYFYPRWTAYADGRPLPVTANADGLLLISAPPQATDIQLIFAQPPRVRVFEIVTVMSWMLILSSLLLAAIKMKGKRAAASGSQ